MRSKETPLMKKVILNMRYFTGVRIFRNNVGMGYQGKSEIFKNPFRVVIKNFRRIKFGLLKGSGDLVGWKTIVVTPEMVGQKIAQFLSVEIKTETGVRSDEQINWCENVRKQGGIAVFVENENEINL